MKVFFWKTFLEIQRFLSNLDIQKKLYVILQNGNK